MNFGIKKTMQERLAFKFVVEARVVSSVAGRSLLFYDIKQRIKVAVSSNPLDFLSVT